MGGRFIAFAAGPHSYGRARTETLIAFAAGPHSYGRARTETLIAFAAGPHSYGRARTETSITFAAGPHSYGRARTGTFITMGGPATPFGPYKVISKRCEEDSLLHNAKLLSLIFTNQITLYPRLAPKRCLTNDLLPLRLAVFDDNL